MVSRAIFYIAVDGPTHLLVVCVGGLLCAVDSFSMRSLNSSFLRPGSLVHAGATRVKEAPHLTSPAGFGTIGLTFCPLSGTYRCMTFQKGVRRIGDWCSAYRGYHDTFDADFYLTSQAIIIIIITILNALFLQGRDEHCVNDVTPTWQNLFDVIEANARVRVPMTASRECVIVYVCTRRPIYVEVYIRMYSTSTCATLSALRGYA